MSPSSPAWINYEVDKLERIFYAQEAAQRGTELHAFAYQAIRLGVKLPATQRTLNLYVNDAIGYKMTPEQILYYSENCFGTADCIGFKRNTLRIHDLKTGVTPAAMTQEEIYAALFCLEYGFKPSEIAIELRLYQNDAIEVHNPDPDKIFHIMDRITTFDRHIDMLRMEGT